MNWNQLQYVIAVKEEKSFSRAAERLYISQPSLSQSIKILEEELGIRLFERKKGEQVLTYAGQIFYTWACDTMASQKVLLEHMADISQEKCQYLRIGISPYRSKILMPSILKQFYACYPNCEIALTELPTYEMKEMLQNEELDFILDTPHPDSRLYHSEALMNEKIMLGVPEAFLDKISKDAVESGYMDLQELRECYFIMMTASQVIGIISRDICESQSFKPKTRLTCNSIENALDLCALQMGIVFVPGLLTTKEEYRGKIRFFSIRNAEDSRAICLVYSRKKYVNKAMALIMQLFREEMKKLMQ